MVARIFGVLFVFLIASQIQAQLPAQRGVAGSGNRPKAAPAGKRVMAEPERAKADLKRYKAGAGAGGVKSGVVINQSNYMIGVRGYGSDDGVVVLSTFQRRDLDQGRSRCAAAAIQVDFRGNGRTVSMYLEPGDVITSIDGFEVKNMEQLVVAVNSADDPHNMEITFIDWRTGNEYTGIIDAMRIK